MPSAAEEGRVSELHEIPVVPRPVEALGALIGPARWQAVQSAAAATRRELGGRRVWNVNSTAAGGGVAEMLHALLGYIRALDVDVRWLVADGEPAFFTLTKRLHNRLHGAPGDGGPLGPDETAAYGALTAARAAALLKRTAPGDVVILHDPQTAGMAPALLAAGMVVIWRCHIGSDHANAWSEQGWAFLRPWLEGCHAFIFTRRPYAPAWVPAGRLAVIPPSIDPFSPKNQELDPGDLPAFWARAGVGPGPVGGPVPFVRADGSGGVVDGTARVVAGGPPPTDEPLVVQVSRWDRLKDMVGVMVGFAEGVVGRVPAHLALVGPEVDGVADDPEQSAVLAECVDVWAALPAPARERVCLLALPMDDLEANAALVNAVQRRADVIVQKSLVEGFGLTAAEGMWKGRPVVASAVGGLVDQVVPGTGLLLDDPTDLARFAEYLVGLLADPAERSRLGDGARRHVFEQYIGDRHLLQHAALLHQVLGPAASDAGGPG